MFLAWYERDVDEKEHVTLQKRSFAHETQRDHLPHFHGSAEMVFATAGEFEVFVNGEKHLVKAGDFCFVKSFEPHKYHYFASSECFVVVISADYFDNANGLKDHVFPTVCSKGEGSERIIQLLSYAYENFDPSSYCLKKGFVDMLIGMISKYYEAKQVSEGSKNGDVLLDAVKYINENSRSDLGIEELSARFGYTPNYFSSIFNRFLGMSFRDYLNWCRMLDYTRIRKNQPEISAVSAAETCGFGSTKSFYRAQKKYGTLHKIV